MIRGRNFTNHGKLIDAVMIDESRKKRVRSVRVLLVLFGGILGYSLYRAIETQGIATSSMMVLVIVLLVEVQLMMFGRRARLHAFEDAFYLPHIPLRTVFSGRDLGKRNYSDIVSEARITQGNRRLLEYRTRQGDIFTLNEQANVPSYDRFREFSDRRRKTP